MPVSAWQWCVLALGLTIIVFRFVWRRAWGGGVDRASSRCAGKGFGKARRVTKVTAKGVSPVAADEASELVRNERDAESRSAGGQTRPLCSRFEPPRVLAVRHPGHGPRSSRWRTAGSLGTARSHGLRLRAEGRSSGMGYSGAVLAHGPDEGRAWGRN